MFAGGPSGPTGPSGPPGQWGPPSQSQPWQQQPPRRRRTGLVVAAAVAAVLVVVGGVTAVVVAGDGEPEAEASSSTTEAPTTTTTAPTTPPTTPTTSPPTTDPPEPPEPPEPKPFYPDVPAAKGIRVELGAASLRTPTGWGSIDKGNVDQGVGARDYGDSEGFYSSVFIRRSVPAFPLDSIALLEIAAEAAPKALDKNDTSVKLERSSLLKRAWLDGQQVARVGASYYSPGPDLYFREETWFAQRGKYLYRVTFQHSKIDSDAERRSQIDPMVVSFRWSS